MALTTSDRTVLRKGQGIQMPTVSHVTLRHVAKTAPQVPLILVSFQFAVERRTLDS